MAAGSTYEQPLYRARVDRDEARLRAAGTRFREAARREVYGMVAVFEDPWGNPWDLIEPEVR